MDSLIPDEAADDLLPTEHTASEAELRELFDMEPDDEPPEDVIGVCAGEWRREGPDLWRVWAYPGWADDEADDDEAPA